jgi:hypothetical protein
MAERSLHVPVDKNTRRVEKRIRRKKRVGNSFLAWPLCCDRTQASETEIILCAPKLAGSLLSNDYLYSLYNRNAAGTQKKKKKNKEQIWKPILTDGGRNPPQKKKFGNVLKHRDEASSAIVLYL